MWAVAGEAYFPCEKVEDILPSGQYMIEVSQQRGLYFNRTKVNLDGLIDLPDDSSQKVLDQIKHFWNNRAKYDSMNVLHKRGFLLWGPPGSGKTTTVQQVSKMIVDKGGISVYVKDPETAAKGLEVLRRIEPKRPVVVMMEDIDAMMGNRSHDEGHLLALLDGELQIDNVVFIATTNYPERLPPRLVNRPSRFDVVQKIDMPSDEARKVYLKHKTDDLLEKEAYPNEQAAEAKQKLSERISNETAKKASQDHALASARADLTKAKADGDDVAVSQATKKVSQLETNLKDTVERLAELDAELENVSADNRSMLDYWVEQTNGFSLAHLKELIVSVNCYEIPFDNTVKRLRKMQGTKLTGNSSGNGIGL